jgi:hypothetical protein
VATLTRASLDLRGIRPSVEELDAVLADPGQLDPLVEGFLLEDRFGTRVGEMFAEVFLTRDEYPFVQLAYYLERWSIEHLSRSIGAEPVRVVQRIAGEDMPWSELLLADWTMGNAVLADIWPLDIEDGIAGWEVAHYTDGRPPAGLLSSTGMWWHYGSMENNLNRGRANAVSRIFLCADYLDNEIDFGTDQPLTSEAALGDAIRTDPACASCHDTLDPIASHFYGYWWFGGAKGMPQEISRYHPHRERAWQDYDALPPAFMGTPTNGLVDLANAIVADPRFDACMVKRSWELLHRRPITSEERVWLTAQRDREDTTFRGLFRDLVASPAYTSSEHLKLMSPGMLSTSILDLTGFQLERDNWDLLSAPLLGFNAMAGGVDPFYRDTPLHAPSPTYALVMQRIAEAAAVTAVSNDRLADTPRLFVAIDWTETADDPAVVAQLQVLHARFLSERLAEDDPRLQTSLQLWQAVHAVDGTEAAWAAVLSLLLRDPAFWVY